MLTSDVPSNRSARENKALRRALAHLTALGCFALTLSASAAEEAVPSPCRVHEYTVQESGASCRVPPGIHRIAISAGGGQGGYASGSQSGGPGRGRVLNAVVPVVPGEILTIWVGAHASGRHAGKGWPEAPGGAGGSSGTQLSAKGGGGGSASGLIGSSSGVLLAAGGGGGPGGRSGILIEGGNGGDGSLNPFGGGPGRKGPIGHGGSGGGGGASEKPAGGDGTDANSVGAAGGGGGGGGGYFPVQSGAPTGGGGRGRAGDNDAGGGGGGGGTSWVVPEATDVQEKPAREGRGVDGFVSFVALRPGS